jgi:SH3 domain-containing YSC84-like protein 1
MVSASTASDVVDVTSAMHEPSICHDTIANALVSVREGAAGKLTEDPAQPKWRTELGIEFAGKLVMNRRTFLVALPLCVSACYRESTPSATDPEPQQRIVDRCTAAIQRMRESGRFSNLDYFLGKSKGVMIFPRVIKASLIFGGEGGNGVFVARRSDGDWSPPAFYSLGAGSAGFQLGYQEATVVLFFMNRAAVTSAVDHGITLGSDVSVAAGTIGESGSDEAKTTASDIYQLVDVGGLFAGVSLDGTVVGARERFNAAYYSGQVSAATILLQDSFESSQASELRAVLRAR